MNKRGQATVFIIIGIVLVLIVALYIVGTQTKFIPPILGGGSAEDQLKDVDDHIVECLNEIGTNEVNRIGLQGGYLSIAPTTFRLWNDSSISYLCYKQPGMVTCSNRLLTIPHMEYELEKAISQSLSTCISVNDYSKNARTAEEWIVDVEILPYNVDLTLDFPVEIMKDEQTVKQEEFKTSLDVPLGELYDVSMDIVNSEATIGDFDQLIYMLQKMSRYSIYKHRPYPDKIYQLKLREDPYIFQFAIEGEDTT